MALCIGTCAALLLGGAALRKRSMWKKIRSPCRILLIFSVLGLIAQTAGRLPPDGGAPGQINRPSPGEGDLETEACFSLEREGTKYSVTLTVPERKYAEKEERALIAAATEEIKETFCGANASLEEIVSNPVVCDSYQDGAVSAEWLFSDDAVISADGEIIRERRLDQKEEVEASVILRCGKSEECQSFTFWVVPDETGGQERRSLAIQEQINLQDETIAAVTLPDMIEGEKILWEPAASFQAAEFLGLGVLAAIAMVYAEKENGKRRIQKRKREMTLSYPEFASKLSLMLGAGMTIPAALRNMDRMYRQRVERGGRREAVYEELRGMVCDMENGKGELRAYQDFSERCDLQPYRKLASLLILGQKEGNRKLTEQLNEEADRVFSERKNAARRLGEEAGTKMLLPMMMMLIIVMGIVVIPAFLSIYGM